MLVCNDRCRAFRLPSGSVCDRIILEFSAEKGSWLLQIRGDIYLLREEIICCREILSPCNGFTVGTILGCGIRKGGGRKITSV